MHPNPAADEVLIQLQTSGNVEYAVYGLDGSLWLAGCENFIKSNEQIILINTSRLPAGSYIVALQTTRAVISKPLMILR
jgi:hypothetical protein